MNILNYITKNYIKHLENVLKLVFVFVKFDRQCFLPNRIILLPLEGYKTKLIFENLYKIMKKIQVGLKYDKYGGYFTE
jgi:hypothetical protein